MNLTDAFRHQSKSCASLGSPFMGQLMNLCADRLRPGTPLTDRMFNWPGDLGPASESLPLRFAGALHALRLNGHAGLAAAYPPAQVSDDRLWEAVQEVLEQDAPFIDRFIDLPPQTNEVRRSAALIAGAQVVADRFPNLPIRLSELGASAGLNMNWDRYALDIDQRFGPTDALLTLTPDWNGALPPTAQPKIAERRGVDLNPLVDPLHIRAYLWPDQPERLALTDAALTAPRPGVDKDDAIDWLQPRLKHVPGQLHLIQNTVAWQYFPAQAQARGQKMIEEAGAAAREDTPLAWLSMEADGGKGAALILRVWPGDVTLDLARVDFHGRWVEWSLQ